MTKINRVFGPLQAIIALLFLLLTTSLGFIPILIIGLIKLIPNKRLQSICTRGVDTIVTCWCGLNNYYVNHMQSIHWTITGLDNLKRKDWYLVLANHQSWLDIVILQHLFNRKIPVLKFFIKHQLKWIPLLGFSWWAMGCPFMKRYSKHYLAKKPHKQGKDLIATRKAIESFKNNPASIMNFVEGTRFTVNKKLQQSSPYDHLLKPKAGGVSFVLSAMGKQITSLLDVTIVYGGKNPSLWDFLCKRIPSIKVCIRQVPIPEQFTSSHLMTNLHTQTEFKDWLNQLWTTKDQIITSLKYQESL